MQVKSAIGRASRGLPINGLEAITICGLLELADTLQTTVKTATKEDPDYYSRFTPISQVVGFSWLLLAKENQLFSRLIILDGFRR